VFKGDDYVFWRIRMKSHLTTLGFDILQSIEDGYTTPSSPPINVASKKLCNDNSRVVNAILSGLTINVLVKVMHYKKDKELWDKLKVINERDSKVKQTKIQKIREQFENLNMKEEENILEYPQRVDEIVNSVKALG
jgi:hypothetical protein